MIEYYKNPRSHARGDPNLWLHSGGEISAFELEALAGTHPGVEECAAIAVASDLGEDDIKLCIVPVPGRKLDLAELHEFCRQKMPKFMVPRFTTNARAR